jgi:hypothetical protein
MGEGEQSTTAEFKSKMTPLLDKYKFVQASFVCSAKHQEGVQAVFQFAAMMVSVTEQYETYMCQSMKYYTNKYAC